MSNNKYKIFRNYMTNELKITREDIEQWTKEATVEVAEKHVKQIDFNAIASQVIKSNEYTLRKQIVDVVANSIAEKIKVSM